MSLPLPPPIDPLKLLLLCGAAKTSLEIIQEGPPAVGQSAAVHALQDAMEWGLKAAADCLGLDPAALRVNLDAAHAQAARAAAKGRPARPVVGIVRDDGEA